MASTKKSVTISLDNKFAKPALVVAGALVLALVSYSAGNGAGYSTGFDAGDVAGYDRGYGVGDDNGFSRGMDEAIKEYDNGYWDGRVDGCKWVVDQGENNRLWDLGTFTYYTFSNCDVTGYGGYSAPTKPAGSN
jgi:hypothetical protein